MYNQKNNCLDPLCIQTYLCTHVLIHVYLCIERFCILGAACGTIIPLYPPCPHQFCFTVLYWGKGLDPASISLLLYWSPEHCCSLSCHAQFWSGWHEQESAGSSLRVTLSRVMVLTQWMHVGTSDAQQPFSDWDFPVKGGTQCKPRIFRPFLLS